MGNRRSTMLLGLALGSLVTTFPAQAAETRAQAFTMACDGATKNIVFNMANLGASTNRFIQGGSLIVSEPRGGAKFLRLQAAGAITNVVADLGARQTGSRTDLSGNVLTVATNAAGTVAMQVTGACLGGGLLHGFATVVFFS
jgi:hypothetical protein